MTGACDAEGGALTGFASPALHDLEARFGITLIGRDHSRLEEPETAADRAAAVWVRSTDTGFRRAAGASAPPVWLYDRFKWGPHDWPVRWRDVTRMPRHDCGLMAALSTEIYRFRGGRAFPVQLILRFNPQSSNGWAGLWEGAGLTPHWCSEAFAYHEATAVLDVNNEAHVWDALGRFWLPIRSAASYEGVAAFRIVRDVASDRPDPTVRSQRVEMNRWHLTEPQVQA